MKLSPQDVIAIKRRLEKGEFAIDLAAEYGVNASTISLIKNGKRRKT